MLVGLSQRLTFPPEIAATTLVLWSKSCRPVFIVELTVLWMGAFNEAFKRKRQQYANLAAEVEGRGCKVGGGAGEGGLQRLCGMPASVAASPKKNYSVELPAICLDSC